MFLLLFLILKSPNWQQMSKLYSIIPLILWCLNHFTLVPIIFIIMIFLLLIIMHNCSFHYLKTSFEWWFINRGVSHINWFFLLIFGTVGNVGIKDFPLGDLSFYCVAGGRFCGDSSFSNGSIFSLCFSGVVIKFISHSLFDGVNVFWGSGIFLFLDSDCFVNEGFFHFL